MGEVESTLEVDSDNAVPLQLGHPHHQAVTCDACVVDQNVDMAEILLNLLHGRVGLGEVSRIGGIAAALHSESGDLGYGIPEVVVLLEVGESDVGSGRSELHGDGLSDTAGGTGNQGHLSF